MHFMALHVHGSSNPLGISANVDRIAFSPYYAFKDLITVFAFIIIISLFVFYSPNTLNHPDNYIPGNPMVTPASIELNVFGLFAILYFFHSPGALSGPGYLTQVGKSDPGKMLINYKDNSSTPGHPAQCAGAGGRCKVAGNTFMNYSLDKQAVEDDNINYNVYNINKQNLINLLRNNNPKEYNLNNNIFKEIINGLFQAEGNLNYSFYSYTPRSATMLQAGKLQGPLTQPYSLHFKGHIK